MSIRRNRGFENSHHSTSVFNAQILNIFSHNMTELKLTWFEFHNPDVLAKSRVAVLDVA